MGLTDRQMCFPRLMRFDREHRLPIKTHCVDCSSTPLALKQTFQFAQNSFPGKGSAIPCVDFVVPVVPWLSPCYQPKRYTPPLPTFFCPSSLVSPTSSLGFTTAQVFASKFTIFPDNTITHVGPSTNKPEKKKTTTRKTIRDRAREKKAQTQAHNNNRCVLSQTSCDPLV